MHTTILQLLVSLLLLPLIRINAYTNTPGDVFNVFTQNGQCAAILYPGDIYETGAEYDSSPALERYDMLYATIDKAPYDPTAPGVPLSDIAEAFCELAQHLHEKYPKPLLRLLQPVVVRVPDLDATIVFSIPCGTLQEINKAEEADLVINSQPLHFCFAHPYGVQTLGSAGWYTILRNFSNWRRHRILFALNNAELYLRPKYLFMRKTGSILRRDCPEL